MSNASDRSGIWAYILTLVEFHAGHASYLAFRIDAGNRQCRIMGRQVPGRISHTEGPPPAFVRGGIIGESGLEYFDHELLEDLESLMEVGSDQEGVNVVHLITRDCAEVTAVMASRALAIFQGREQFSEEAQRALTAYLYDAPVAPSPA